MAQQFIQRHIVGTNADGTVFDGYMTETQFGPARAGSTGTRWGTCALCHFEFPLGELTVHDGKLVCSKNGCDRDYKELR